MANDKKNRPGVAAPGRQMEWEGFGETTVSENHHTTDLGLIASHLQQGRKNAVNIRYLEAMTGMKNRDVRLLIEKERRGGTPILSDNSRGYYLPGSQEELARCVRSLRGRAKEIERTADAIERGQIP